MSVTFSMSREEMLGKRTFWSVSELGLMQFKNDYPQDLLQEIKRKALAIKEEAAGKRHLDLNFIRGAHRRIPELNDLINWPGRIERLSELAGTKLAPYPLSIIKSAVTFMSPEDGAVSWHGDGIPMTELVALEVDDVEGGEIAVYRGDFDEGFADVEDGIEFPEEKMIRLTHRVGYSVLGQLIRVVHRTDPIRRGNRITLNLNLTSVDKPWVDDNFMYYLGADNPEFDWADEYVDIVKNRQLPAYMARQP